MKHRIHKQLQITLICAAALTAMSASAAEYHFGAGSTPSYDIPEEVTWFNVFAPTDKETAHAQNTLYVDGVRETGAGVLGGYAVSGKDVYDNYVEIQDSEIASSGIDGGIAVEGSAHNNTVKIKGDSLIWSLVTGGTSQKSDAYENAVVIEDNAVITSTIRAGEADEGGDVYGNIVELRGGDYSKMNGGYIAGGTSFGGNAHSNAVHVWVQSDLLVEGGEIFSAESADKSAAGNLVHIHEDGSVKYAFGASVSEGNSWDIAIDNNQVIVEGAAAEAFAAERYVIAENLKATSTAKSSGNTVSVSGTVKETLGILTATIYHSADMPEVNATVTLSDNKLILNEGADVSQASIKLADIEIFEDPAYFAVQRVNNGNLYVKAENNTLVINKWQGEVASIEGFDRWDVHVGDNVKTDQAIVTAGSVALPDNGLTSLSLTMSDKTLEAYQQSGQSVQILKAETVSGELIGEQTEQTVKSESGLIFADANFNADGTLDVTQLHATDKSVGYFEGLTAMLSMTSQAADLAAGSSLKTTLDTMTAGTVGAIGVMEGSSYRVQTGSSINVKGFSALAGVGGKVTAGNGSLDIAGFFEFGHSTFDTVSAFNSSGNGEYYGLGALARWTADAGFFAEGSIRFGWLDADFDGEASTGGYGQDAMYYGAHVGLGWGFDLGASGKADVFGQYFYTKQKFDDMQVAGVDMTADDADSSRTRLGARYSYAGQDAQAWVMAAWDHEFDGETGGKVMSVSVDAPSLEGNSAVAETGVTFGSADTPWSVSARIGGYVGDRDGVYGGLSAAYRF